MTVPGLSQYWFKGNLRPTNPDGGAETFIALGTTGSETFQLISIGDVHVLDDDWANLDGSDQAVQYHGIANIENIEEGGSWRRIEVWMAEDGGGDGAIVYVGNLDDPDIFDDTDGGALSQEARDKFAIKQEDLRTTIAPVIGGESTASLDTSVQYIMQVGADGSDQIVVNDNDGFLTTTLDVAGATIVVQALEGLTEGTEGTTVSLFDADMVTGGDSLNLVLPDELIERKNGVGSGPTPFFFAHSETVVILLHLRLSPLN